jgi:hypothetical protein
LVRIGWSVRVLSIGISSRIGSSRIGSSRVGSSRIGASGLVRVVGVCVWSKRIVGAWSIGVTSVWSVRVVNISSCSRSGSRRGHWRRIGESSREPRSGTRVDGGIKTVWECVKWF